MNGKSLGATLDVIYKYSRTYTLKGTVLSIISISLLAVQNLSDFTPSFFLGVMQAIVGGCLANLYVVGINQLSDVEIDKVNKPYLPLASGELPVRTGILLTSLYAFLGFGLGWSVKSWPFKLGLFLWYAFGTAYSAHVSATIHAFQSKQRVPPTVVLVEKLSVK
ncbi:putative homogentisate phytyltransferase [Helianthus annuus]|nr:putative homogentisate phytyltransferase [Helianthus annuus]